MEPDPHFRVSAERNRKIVDHFHTHQYTRQEHRSANRSGHTVIDDQVAIRSATDFDCGHSPNRLAVLGDLPM